MEKVARAWGQGLQYALNAVEMGVVFHCGFVPE